MDTKYADVSKDTPYSMSIGLGCETNRPLILHGVVRHYPDDKQLGYFRLTIEPGFDGPEVLSRERLPPGTRLLVTAVRSCTNCLSEDVDFVASMPDATYSLPIYADQGIFRSAELVACRLSGPDAGA